MIHTAKRKQQGSKKTPDAKARKKIEKGNEDGRRRERERERERMLKSRMQSRGFVTLAELQNPKECATWLDSIGLCHHGEF
jgi:hypothetical protein